MNSKKVRLVSTSLILASMLLFASAAMYAAYQFEMIGKILKAGLVDPLEAWSEASYIIWKCNSTHYAARNMSTNMVEFGPSTNASEVINNADDAVTGGKILLKSAVYELDVPINLNPFNSLVGECVSARDYTVLKPSVTFPNYNYLIKIVAYTIIPVSSSIENLMLWSPYSYTNDTGGIYIESNWDDSGSLLLNGYVHNIVFQYLWRDIYLKGYIWQWTFDKLTSNGVDASGADAPIVLVKGTATHADNCPKFNYFKNIGINTAGFNVNNYLRIEEGGYNTFEIKIFAGGNVDESIVTLGAVGHALKAIYNHITLFPLDMGWTANTKGCVYLVNNATQNVILGYLNPVLQLPIRLDYDAHENYIGFIPWSGPAYINATGAGTDNVIEFLSVGAMTSLTIQGGAENFRLLGAGVQNSGDASASNGTWIPHGLVITPTNVRLTVNEVDARYIIQAYDNMNSTHFQIYLWDDTAGAVEAVAKKVAWFAEYQP